MFFLSNFTERQEIDWIKFFLQIFVYYMELKNVFLSKLFRIILTFFLMFQLIASLVDMYEPQSSRKMYLIKPHF